MRCSVSELPSRSVQLREQHIAFYNRVWAKDDPFWDDNQPGNLWNCKCDWQQVDDPVTDGNPQTAIRHQGLDGNPAKTGQIFTDNSSYVKKAPEGTELSCRKTNRNETAKQGRILNKNQRITFSIDAVEHEFDFSKFRQNGTKVDVCHHFTASMIGDDSYWLKNEILLNPQHYFDKSRLAASSGIDEHNTGAATIELKNATDKFFYLETLLGNGGKIILHVGRYKSSQKLYLYHASYTLPVYVQNPQ